MLHLVLVTLGIGDTDTSSNVKGAGGIVGDNARIL
jgi:hypothetical protein